MCPLPYSDFRRLTEEDASPLFKEIERRLKAVDLQFFADKAEDEEIGMLIRADVSYDKDDCVTSCVDLGMFPHFAKVVLSDLSQDQQAEAMKLKRNIDNEPPKLISTMQEREVLDFTENLLYQLVHQSCRIKQVREVIIFRQASFFKKYMCFLQKERAAAMSKLLGKLIKALANNLTGKLHQRISSYSRTAICSSFEEFERATSDTKFFDFKVLSPETCIIIYDGVVITKHSNVPSVSARVYSRSKQIMWSLFFHYASRLSYFGGDGACRLALSDTDSLCLSVERPRSMLERHEVESLMKSGVRTPYCETLHASRYVELYIKCFGPTLDYSSISKVNKTEEKTR